MSAKKRARGQAAIDAAVERELGLARILGVAERLAFYTKLLRSWRAIVAADQAVVDGEWHQRHAGRGERWSDTYRLRRDSQSLAEAEAIVDALTDALGRTA